MVKRYTIMLSAVVLVMGMSAVQAFNFMNPGDWFDNDRHDRYDRGATTVAMVRTAVDPMAGVAAAPMAGVAAVPMAGVVVPMAGVAVMAGNRAR